MKVIEQYSEIIPVGDGYNGYDIIEHLEKVGRTCYKSTDKITEGSAEKFIRGIVKSGHGSVIEHFSLTVRFVTSRDVTHQIVRHRLASFAQESQRYVNYTLDRFGSEIVFIKPVYLEENTPPYNVWKSSCEIAESSYFNLVESGLTAEEARAVLPNCCKTELIMTANLRELRHFFEVRCNNHAQLPIRLLALDLLDQMHHYVPVVFEDLYEKFC